MAEYITKEAAIEAFENGEADVIEDYGDGADFGFGLKNIKSTINSIPAADVAPVVRCRGCKYCYIYNTADVFAICRKTGETFIPFGTDIREHFCSYGERKETSHDN